MTTKPLEKKDAFKVYQVLPSGDKNLLGEFKNHKRAVQAKRRFEKQGFKNITVENIWKIPMNNNAKY